jgi:hypothetical protein
MPASQSVCAVRIVLRQPRGSQGTHDGALHLPFGMLPPTGKRMDAPCCDVFKSTKTPSGVKQSIHPWMSLASASAYATSVTTPRHGSSRPAVTDTAPGRSNVRCAASGWGSPRTIGLLAAGVVLLAGFLAIERRSLAPLMPLSIFRRRGLAAADLTLLLTAAAVFATFFFVSLYLQQILGYRPLSAGLAFLPFSAGIATGATVARRLVPRLGVRVVPLIGLALATAGMIVLTQVPVHGRYGSNVLPGILPLGVGLGLTFVPITLAGTSEVSGEDAGLASGLLNTAQQVGGSIGLAILATLAASRTASLLHSPIAHGSVPAARVSGFHLAFMAAAALLTAAWTIAVLQLRTRRGREARPTKVSRDLAARAVGCAQCALRGGHQRRWTPGRPTRPRPRPSTSSMMRGRHRTRTCRKKTNP